MALITSNIGQAPGTFVPAATSEFQFLCKEPAHRPMMARCCLSSSFTAFHRGTAVVTPPFTAFCRLSPPFIVA